MSKVEYFLVFETILYAIVVSRLVTGFAGLYRDKGEYVFSWTHALFNLCVFLYIVQTYFAGRDFDDYRNLNTSLEFLLYLVLPPAVMAFGIFLMFPTNNHGVDFREVLVKYRIALSLCVCYPAILTVLGNLESVNYALSEYVYWVPHATVILFLILFMFTKKLFWAKAYAIVGTSLVLYFMIFVN